MNGQQHEIRAKKAKAAVTYVTFGTLMVIWSAVWLAYLLIPSDLSGAVYLASGVVLSGLAVLTIGITMGIIGREANADEEPAEASPHSEVKAPPRPHEEADAPMNQNVVVKPADRNDVEVESERTPSG